MGLILIALLIIILVGAFGFAVHVLWWVAIAALIIWLLGFLFRAGDGASARRRRHR
jgi:hypothetical protein